MGYYRAGFQEIVGVDTANQKNYPFHFVQADALEYLDARGQDFDVIHASPPCQIHVKGLGAVNMSLGRPHQHEDQIARTRSLLRQIGIPYVIENVEGSTLIDPVRLCGSSFEPRMVRRHRLFESSINICAPPCTHHLQSEAKYWTSWRPAGKVRLSQVVQVYGNAGGRAHWNHAMGIDWMTPQELTQAIPPAYTEHIGAQLLAAIRLEESA